MDTAVEKGWLSLGQRCGQLGVKKRVELESLLCMDHALTFFLRLSITTLSFPVLLPWFRHLLSMTCVCNVLHSMRAHALNPRPTEVHVFTSAPLRPFDKDGDDGRDGHFQTDDDESDVIFQRWSRKVVRCRARRCNGGRGCVEPAEGLQVFAVNLCNLIVPLKGRAGPDDTQRATCKRPPRRSA